MNGSSIVQLHRTLVDAIRRTRPGALSRPVTVAEIYQDLVPYRTARAAGFEMNADYEYALLRLLAGEGDLARIEPREVRDKLRLELESANPDVGLFRHYAACDVWVNPGDLPADVEPELSLELDQMVSWEDEFLGSTIQPVPEPPAATPAPVAPVSAPAPVAPAPVAPAPAAFAEPEPLAAAEPQPVAAEPEWVAEPPAQVRPRFEIAAAVPPQPATEPEVESGQAEEACAFCGGELPTDRVVNFCPFCGSDQSQRPCPACGELLDQLWRFCVACGTRVRPLGDHVN